MTLSLTEVRGTQHTCGKLYGESIKSKINDFYERELGPNKYEADYAKKCWAYIQKKAPGSASFIEGLSVSTDLSVDELTLLLLHEEVVQQQYNAVPHCTAFAIRSTKTIVAQNWDWPPDLYELPGLLKMQPKGNPATLTYHYPGLWSACGINEYGLALMFTDGYNVPVQISVGIPTYVLIYEILRCKTVDQALNYLSTINNAGAFIFILGDALGNTCIIEATPGEQIVIRSRNPLYRANHFICHPKINSRKRSHDYVDSKTRYKSLERRLRNGINKSSAKKILTSRPLFGKNNLSMSIDSLIAVCEERSLHTRRGKSKSNRWQRITI